MITWAATRTKSGSFSLPERGLESAGWLPMPSLSRGQSGFSKHEEA